MISENISGDWLAQMKRARLHLSLMQFTIYLDCLEEIIRADYGSVGTEVKDRRVDTFTTTKRVKVLNK